MKLFLTAPIVLALLIYVAPPCEGEQNTVQAQQHADQQFSKSSDQQHSTAETTTKNEPPHWYKSPEWWLVILGFPTLAVLMWQAIVMNAATKAARDSANAALVSAKAFTDAERAWIITEIAWQAGPHILEGDGTEGKSTGVFVTYTCHNLGKSFAQVTEKGYVFKIVNSLSPEPDFSEMDVFHYAAEYVKSGESTVPYKLTPICKGHRRPDSLMVIYGKVKYRDVFGEHETRFGYSISGMGNLERLPGDSYKNYNQHT